MAGGKHKRSEVHSGTPIVDTEQISITVSPEAYEFIKSKGGSVSSTVKGILESRFGIFEIENLTPNKSNSSGIRCKDCEYLGIEHEDGVCESRCYYSSTKGKKVSRCSDKNGLSGIDLVDRNLGLKGAPNWCPKLLNPGSE